MGQNNDPKNRKVLLEGEGEQELLAGYNKQVKQQKKATSTPTTDYDNKQKYKGDDKVAQEEMLRSVMREIIEEMLLGDEVVEEMNDEKILKKEKVGKFEIGLLTSAISRRYHAFISEGKYNPNGALPLNFTMSPGYPKEWAEPLFNTLKETAKKNKNAEPHKILAKAEQDVTLEEAKIELDYAGEDDPKKFAKKFKLKAKVVDPNGPGGGWPVVEFSGKTADIKKMLVEYTGGDEYMIEDLEEFIQESAVGSKGRTSFEDADAYLEENAEMVNEFKKIVRKMGGKSVAEACLKKMKMGTRKPVEEGISKYGDEILYKDVIYDRFGKKTKGTVKAIRTENRPTGRIEVFKVNNDWVKDTDILEVL